MSVQLLVWPLTLWFVVIYILRQWVIYKHKQCYRSRVMHVIFVSVYGLTLLFKWSLELKIKLCLCTCCGLLKGSFGFNPWRFLLINLPFPKGKIRNWYISYHILHIHHWPFDSVLGYTYWLYTKCLYIWIERTYFSVS